MMRESNIEDTRMRIIWVVGGLIWVINGDCFIEAIGEDGVTITIYCYIIPGYMFAVKISS